MLTNEHICVIMVKNTIKRGVKMSKESKIFSPNLWSAQETITHYESFGWELLSLNGNQIVMSRESQNPVYPEMVKYQGKYEALEAEYKGLMGPQRPAPLPPVNYIGAIIGLLCFVVPGALYIAYRIKKNKEHDMAIEDYNNSLNKYNARRQSLLEEMKQTAEQSRTVFFSKQG